jgi:Uma2 family endonuclease
MLRSSSAPRAVRQGHGAEQGRVRGIVQAVASEPIPRLTFDQYLELERAAEFRSEFIDGQMVAKPGGTRDHAVLLGNMLYQLHSRLQGTGCEVFGCDFRIQVSRHFCTYPDVAVVCGEVALANEEKDCYTNPAVVVEVLSPSSEGYDRGEKFQRYRTLSSLRDYILVDQQRVLVEHFTRQPDNTWTLRDYQGLDDELRIESIGVSIPLQRIYAGVEIAAE